MTQEKKIPALSIFLVAILFITLCLYWFNRFYHFLPMAGTSTASISALWGQFIVSFMLVVIVSALIIYSDRRYEIRFYKLTSFWIIVLSIVAVAGYFMYKDIDYGISDTHGLGEAFDYNQLDLF